METKMRVAITTVLDDTNVLWFTFSTPRELAHWLKLRAKPVRTKHGAVAIQRIVAIEEVR